MAVFQCTSCYVLLFLLHLKINLHIKYFKFNIHCTIHMCTKLSQNFVYFLSCTLYTITLNVEMYMVALTIHLLANNITIILLIQSFLAEIIIIIGKFSLFNSQYFKL